MICHRYVAESVAAGKSPSDRLRQLNEDLTFCLRKDIDVPRSNALEQAARIAWQVEQLEEWIATHGDTWQPKKSTRVSA